MPFASMGRVAGGFRIAGGWVVNSELTSGTEVLRVGVDATVKTLAHGTVTGVVKAPDGTPLITAVSGGDTVLLHAADSDTIAGHWRPVGFVDDDRLVLTPATYDAEDAGAAPIWSMSRRIVGMTLPARLRPTTAARGFIGGADLTRVLDPITEAPCGFVVAVAAPDLDVWRSCYFVPRIIGGDFAILLPSCYDGFGPGGVTLLDTASWTVRKDWSVGSYFTMVAQDRSHALLLAAHNEDSSSFAIMRCSLGAACERASSFIPASSADGSWETTLLDP